MIRLSQLIEFIRNGGSTPITTPIYRTICPLELSFPIVTMTHSSSDLETDLSGDINIEKLTCQLNCFGESADDADDLSIGIFDKLKTLKGTVDETYFVSNFLLNNRKSIDYTDEITNKLVYGNQLEYRIIVKKKEL